MVNCYHKKGFNLLKLGYILPHLAIICPQKSNTAKSYPFTERREGLLVILRETIVDFPSIVFTGKCGVNETLLRDSTNRCKTTVGFDASQLYSSSKCQAMPTVLYTIWEVIL